MTTATFLLLYRDERGNYRQKLPCGHTARVSEWTDFFTLTRTRCMRCHLEAKAAAKASA